MVVLDSTGSDAGLHRLTLDGSGRAVAAYQRAGSVGGVEFALAWCVDRECSDVAVTDLTVTVADARGVDVTAVSAISGGPLVVYVVPWGNEGPIGTLLVKCDDVGCVGREEALLEGVIVFDAEPWLEGIALGFAWRGEVGLLLCADWNCGVVERVVFGQFGGPSVHSVTTLPDGSPVAFHGGAGAEEGEPDNLVAVCDTPRCSNPNLVDLDTVEVVDATELVRDRPVRATLRNRTVWLAGCVDSACELWGRASVALDGWSVDSVSSGGYTLTGDGAFAPFLLTGTWDSEGDRADLIVCRDERCDTFGGLALGVDSSQWSVAVTDHSGALFVSFRDRGVLGLRVCPSVPACIE
jgi:hypothetical protein